MNQYIDILPFIERLVQEKSIETGLFICNSSVENMSFHSKNTSSWTGDWQICNIIELESYPFNQRIDLSICDIDCALDIEEPLLIRGLTRLRDLLARRVCLIVRNNSNALPYTNILRALGFSRLELPIGFSEQVLGALATDEFWQFNILEYKQVPDWLNAKYWANPENWDKYRW